MTTETTKEAIATGIQMNMQINESVSRVCKTIAYGFEALMILSPETALEVMNQLSGQINEATVAERNEEYEQHLEVLTGKVTL